MKALILAGLLAVASLPARSAIEIAPTARIYIQADSGFDIFLAAALAKKHVPVVVTTDKSKAEYSLEGVSDARTPPAVGSAFVQRSAANDGASARLVDLKSGDVIFAWSVDKRSPFRRRTAAEACARRVAAEIAKASRPSTDSPPPHAPLKTRVRDLYQSLSSKEPALAF